MSTLITYPLSFPVIPAHGPPARLPQPDSGPIPAVRCRGWSSWMARLRLRRALRDLAEDKHLLNDVGLTREQALEEAAKPFWR
jgi:uncharacterized protein YjiS (DUF1127 family)